MQYASVTIAAARNLMPYLEPDFSSLKDLCQAQSIRSRLSPQQRTWKIHMTCKLWGERSCHSSSYSLILVQRHHKHISHVY